MFDRHHSKNKPIPYMNRKMSTKRPNQFTKNPKQESFFKYYYDPRSETFGNVYQSGLRAGYSESYCRVMSVPAINNLWLRDNNKTDLTKDHIIKLIEKLALKGVKENDQLRALELLAKMNGMIVDRSQSVNVNIETALESLK